QDALNVRDPRPGEEAPPPVAGFPPAQADDGRSAEEDDRRERAWRASRAPAAETHETFNGEDMHAVEEPSALRLPANDDRESIGQILRTLQRRPARTSYIAATIFAAIWMLAGLGLSWAYLPQLQDALSPSGLTAPVLGTLAAVFFAPIIFFYVLAHMHWR